MQYAINTLCTKVRILTGQQTFLFYTIVKTKSEAFYSWGTEVEVNTNVWNEWDFTSMYLVQISGLHINCCLQLIFLITNAIRLVLCLSIRFPCNDIWNKNHKWKTSVQTNICIFQLNKIRLSSVFNRVNYFGVKTKLPFSI